MIPKLSESASDGDGADNYYNISREGLWYELRVMISRVEGKASPLDIFYTLDSNLAPSQISTRRIL